MSRIRRIAVTGGAGQIAYSLLFRIAAGELFRERYPIALHILELPEALQALQGVKMELEDGNYPLLQEIVVGSDPYALFADVDVAILMGAKPRTLGMERADLLKDNGKIFQEQGRALDRVASKDVRVLVVGNPCNTNCLIARAAAKRIRRENFFAMTRLDENRARGFLARKALAHPSEIKHLSIWGNHSSTQVIDFVHASVHGSAVEQLIDRSWLEGEYQLLVRKRGEAVIASRGKSSAASAAQSVIDTFHSLQESTLRGDCFSLAVSSDANAYGIEEGLIFSFPCTSQGGFDYTVEKGLALDPFLEQGLKETVRELTRERETIRELI